MSEVKHVGVKFIERTPHRNNDVPTREKHLSKKLYQAGIELALQTAPLQKATTKGYSNKIIRGLYLFLKYNSKHWKSMPI